jgi:hypothetical protein
MIMRHGAFVPFERRKVVQRRKTGATLKRSGGRQDSISSSENPLLWTTELMAPESYVLKAAIDGWILNESGEKIRRRADIAYNQYQHCGSNAALRLFSTGW